MLNNGVSTVWFVVWCTGHKGVSAKAQKKKFLIKYANSATEPCQLFGVGALSEYHTRS